MSAAEVRLTIEGRPVAAPAGTMLVEAAKRAGIDIPVFCYHPKLDPVGMCRMCLVEIGRPERDRASGDWVRDGEGKPVIRFGSKLETACTTPVGEGWEVRAASANARQGQKEIVEFLLTSHPLDCPVCDKGGECPLQELTMDYGPGKSRFLYDDKVDLAKRVPLGELIYLDRERCIQCARCTRFQEDIAADPVIGFEMRGRELQIVTYSDPGFDSYFSGNTTDICPVGALTTADFRFEARPWELRGAASLCLHCPVGCNIVLNVRRQPDAAGRTTVQRVMPRQNESVNEIWICDKGRFGHHFAGSENRLRRPWVRQGDDLVETDWGDALRRAADGLRAAGREVFGLAGGRASTEDLYQFRGFVEGLGGQAALASGMGGGEWVERAGAAPGTDLGRLGKGDAALIIAADLHEEAPIRWLRLKQAAERGAAIVVANARPTRMEDHARWLLRFRYGETLRMAQALTGDLEAGEEPGEAAEIAAFLSSATNVLVFFGSDGLLPSQSESVAAIFGRWLTRSGRVGRPQNGLVPVWPQANTQGGYAVGLGPAGDDLRATLRARAVILMACDPAGDDPELALSLDEAGFVVVQDLFLTESARRADVVFPAQAFTEREGSYVNGLRRLQRTYPAVPPIGEAHPDWRILADLGGRLGLTLEERSAGALLSQMARERPVLRGLDYSALAKSNGQWPPVGGRDLYFGGTAYSNSQGVGVPLPLEEGGVGGEVSAAPGGAEEAGLWLVPVHRLYDRAITLMPSRVLETRLAQPEVLIHPEDAKRIGLAGEGEVELTADGRRARARARVSDAAPPGAVLAPLSVGLPYTRPTPIEVRPAGGA
ncbi:MAG: NADH-quinone oxidoreductase subunit NuoG [Anaerolineales bacterium]